MQKGVLIHPDELTYEWINRMVTHNIDVLGIHPVGGAFADQSLQALTEAMKTNAFKHRIDYARSKGISIEYELHAMRYLLPSSLFSTHPEYFRMNEEGIRVNDYNLCPTNQEALDIVAHATVDLAKQLYGSCSNYYFWLDDVKGAYCSCEKCRAYSPSDQQLLVLNHMIDALKQYDAKAKLAYLAYVDCLMPPTHIQPKEGIFLEYAPIGRNFKIPLNDPNCEINHTHIAPLQDLLKVFGLKDAKVLEYWLDNSLFSGWTKPPKPLVLDHDLIKEDIMFYHQQGFDNIASFACYLGPDYEALYGDIDLLPWSTVFIDISF